MVWSPVYIKIDDCKISNKHYIGMFISCGATQYMVLCVRMLSGGVCCLSGPQIYKIIFTEIKVYMIVQHITQGWTHIDARIFVQ